MGILDQLAGSQSNTGGPAPQDTTDIWGSSAPKVPDAPGTSGTPAAALNPPEPPPAPCGTCRSPFAWLDTYGTLHCCDCQPAPRPAFVHRLLGVAGDPAAVDAGIGEYWWEELVEGKWCDAS